MKSLKPWVFNAATLVVVGLFVLVQGAIAKPGAEPTGPLAASQVLISYQGTLTDPDGNPINDTVTMEFALWDDPTGGNRLWGPETQSVEVSDGLFSVLLGSVTPIAPANLIGNLYLNIKVNSELLLPREQLTSSIVPGLAVSGDSTAFVEGNLQVGYNAWIPEYAGMDGNDMAVLGTLEQHGSGGTRVYRLGIGTDPVAGEGTLAMGGNIDMNGKAITDSGGVTFRSHFHINVPVDRHGGFWDLKNDNYILMVGSDSQHIDAQRKLDMNGNSVTNCGALTEANLQTEEELAAERIDRFETGDILCWAGERLEKCARAGDPLVQAVADPDGRPIVIGAEVIKVIGPVHYGDLLVASNMPGYATVDNDPQPGAVIAQALEDFDGEKGIIRAMIRKF
jgi:hypothetical protein